MLSLDSIFSNSSDIALCVFSFPFPWVRPKWCSSCSFTFCPSCCQVSHGAYIRLHGYVVQPFGLRLLWLLLTSHGKSFSTTTGIIRPIVVSVRPHGISPGSFPVYPPDLRTKVTAAFWTLMPIAISSAWYALYQVSVRRATVSLLLLLPHTSRCEACKSLSDSSATTLLGTSTQDSGHARHTTKSAFAAPLPPRCQPLKVTVCGIAVNGNKIAR